MSGVCRGEDRIYRSEALTERTAKMNDCNCSEGNCGDTKQLRMIINDRRVYYA